MFEIECFSQMETNPGNCISQIKYIYFPVLFFYFTLSGWMKLETIFTILFNIFLLQSILEKLPSTTQDSIFYKAKDSNLSKNLHI